MSQIQKIIYLCLLKNIINIYKVNKKLKNRKKKINKKEKGRIIW